MKKYTELEAVEAVRGFAKNALQTAACLKDQKAQVQAECLKDSGLVKALAQRAINDLCNTFLYDARKITKENIIRSYSDMAEANKTKRDLSVIAATYSLLDSFACGDRPIGDCNREALMEQAVQHRAVAKGNEIRANIYETVAASLKPGEIVRQRLSNRQLEIIIRTAQGIGKHGKRKQIDNIAGAVTMPLMPAASN